MINNQRRLLAIWLLILLGTPLFIATIMILYVTWPDILFLVIVFGAMYGLDWAWKELRRLQVYGVAATYDKNGVDCQKRTTLCATKKHERTG